jgi:hypothetical protein
VPRYFFHVYDGDQLVIEDAQGIELPNEQAAREASESMIKAVLGEPEFVQTASANRSFHVIDESGRIIISIPFN